MLQVVEELLDAGTPVVRFAPTGWNPHSYRIRLVSRLDYPALLPMSLPRWLRAGTVYSS